MDQLRPLRGEQPQRRGALRTEAALASGDLAVAVVLVGDLGAEDADGLARILDLQGRRVGGQLDGVAAAARGLAADRAIAALVGLRRMAERGEMHGAAAAGAFEVEG